MPRKASKAAPPRKRRTAEAARDAILDAAERRLVDAGPAGIRLKEVAGDVGVSHPTVLHHFGSREALVEAVVERAFASIHDEIVAAMQEPPGEESAMALVDRVHAALHASGRGRVFTWIALSGYKPGPDDRRLRLLAELSHAHRKNIRGKGTPPLPPLPPFEDTLFAILLTTLVLVAESTVWPMVAESAGVATDSRTEGRFRAWFARLLAKHLREGGPAP